MKENERQDTRAAQDEVNKDREEEQTSPNTNGNDCNTYLLWPLDQTCRKRGFAMSGVYVSMFEI
jgi:hypothetical protein